MTDDSTDARRSDHGKYSRRTYLASAGALGTGLVAGGVGSFERQDARATVGAVPASDGSGGREDFLWLGASLWQAERVRANLYAFARRHDLAVVLVKSRSPGEESPADLRAAMEAASAADLDVWLNVGLLNGVAAPTLVADEEAREDHLAWLRSIASAHGELFDGGRVVLWQEAPVMGQWVEGGAWTQAAVDNLLELGPRIFAAQRGAITSANDALDVGLFVHFPYVVDSKYPDVFPELVDGIRSEGVEPAFAFADFYRGWYEKDVGPGPANAAVRSLVGNARDALDGRPVYYLGQSHTINPNHTPSKQSMRMNLRASLAAGAAGLGWYVRNRYVTTESGFDPFVPNVEGVDVDAAAVNTLTVARDRFLYPWLATLATGQGFDPAAAFDLWLVGDGLGHYDHRLSLRTADGRWEYVGDFGGYADGTFPEGSAVTDRATIFRALDRDRFLADGTLQCRIETDGDADGATLQSALVMPCQPDAYVSEQAAVEYVDGPHSLEAFTLGRSTGEVELRPGETRSVSVQQTAESTPTLRRLRHPESMAAFGRLAAFEAFRGPDPDACFDLWVREASSGGGATGDDPTGAVPALRDRDGVERSPAEESVVAATDGLTICHGLARDRFLEDSTLSLAGDPPATVAACYAMPYAGTATFRSPERAAALLSNQPDEAEIFSIDVVRPG